MKFQLYSKTKNIGCGGGVFLKWLILGFKSMRNSEKGFGQFKINPKPDFSPNSRPNFLTQIKLVGLF